MLDCILAVVAVFVIVFVNVVAFVCVDGVIVVVASSHVADAREQGLEVTWHPLHCHHVCLCHRIC